MGTKVRDVKKNTITYPDNNDGLPQIVTMDVPVVEGKLILIRDVGEPCGTLWEDFSGNLIIHSTDEGDRQYRASIKPIMISDTEKIEVGDWTIANGKLEQVLKMQIAEDDKWQYKTATAWFSNCKKVLVLPEQFSPNDLQKIVNGEMKHGDNVLIECEKVNHPNPEDRVEHRYKWRYETKLNSTKQVTLYLIEKEIKYGRNEVIDICYKYHNFIKAMEGNRTAPEKFQIKHMSSDEWFQIHVK